MSQPQVVITELDGALGVLPATAGRLFAVVGVSSKGPLDTPATYARAKSLVADYGDGPGVEAASHYIEKYGRPVVFVRTGATNPGTFPAADAVVFTGTGTSVITVDDVGTAPHDDYEFALEVVKGGTIGVDGITVRWSLDGGRTWSPETALGVATLFVFPGSGGVQIDFAAGTLVAGDRADFRGDAPLWNTAEIGSALDALFASAVSWEICHVVGNVDGTSFDVIDPKFTGAIASGKYRSWYGHVRMPDAGETEAAYLTAMQALLAAKATVHGSICAGAAKTISSVSGRSYRRPTSFVVAAREQSVSEEINVADVNLGSLPGVSIRDAHGNADEHDESLNPGLDDARFTVLRTWEGIPGIYVNRPRIFSADGSDFDLHTKRRVLNIAHGALRTYFLRRLNRPIRVDAVTGFILEQDALEIEAGAKAVLRSVLLAKPKASAVQVAISRTDNLLSTKTLTGTARVTPLAYPEFIELDLGFLNPRSRPSPPDPERTHPVPDEVRINGNLHSWGSITVKIGEERIYGFTSISYGDNRERVKAYGQNRGQTPRGRSRGKYATDPVVLSGYKATMAKVRAKLADQAGGTGFGNVPFEIVVQYFEAVGDDPVTDVIEECVYGKTANSHEEGPDPLKEDVELDCMRIRWNGLTLFDEEAG